VALLLITVGFSVAALVIGRWWVPILAAATFLGIAAFLIAAEGWEGVDWGELGLYWDVLVAVLTVTGAVIGVAINRLGRDLLRSRSNA
jgi:hypothetical protein